jgi:hypothetical protein
MKFSTAVLPAAAVLVASVASVPIRRGVDPNLVPQFGVTAGTSPDGELHRHAFSALPLIMLQGLATASGSTTSRSPAPARLTATRSST